MLRLVRPLSVLGIAPDRLWLLREIPVTPLVVAVMPVQELTARVVAQLSMAVEVPARVALAARSVLQSSTRPPVVTVAPPTAVVPGQTSLSPSVTARALVAVVV